jgi:hypothetical protein
MKEIVMFVNRESELEMLEREYKREGASFTVTSNILQPGPESRERKPSPRLEKADGKFYTY